MSLPFIHPSLEAMSTIAPLESQSAPLQRGLPHLNLKTVQALHQTIAALQPAIAQLEQELDRLYAQINSTVPPVPDHPAAASPTAIALQLQIQAQEQQLTILRTAYDHAVQTLTSLQAIAA